jgi:uncharacterized protein YyaL (SSP411 family)
VKSNNRRFSVPNSDTAPSSRIQDEIKLHLDKGEKPNRLINEKSPYLLQHAFNPVDWYSWSEPAFEKARSENKLIFLSIGYSTCYWCHVMEREVFENERIASLMNEYFVNIKVDREERPEVDRIYMKALTGITGSGGWPMSMFLTPDLKPFYGATYIPPVARYGSPAFPDLIKDIHDQWHRAPEKFYKTGNQVLNFIKENAFSNGTELSLNETVLKKAYNKIAGNFDTVHKGFGEAPKFPRPMIFNFLFHYYKRFGEEKSKSIALETLKEIANGGIHDHIGGGFHRYATDNSWRVPHFEKMLYDQAQLLNSYLDAYLITHDDFYSSIAKDILEFIIGEMTSADGGFFSALDAENAIDNSNSKLKKEGAYYLWKKGEIDKILTTEESEIFCFVFGIKEHGNVNGAASIHADFNDENIIYQSHTIEETATHFNMNKTKVKEIVNTCRNKLALIKKERPYPHLDDKILTSWNGLMISAFSNAYKIIRDERYLTAAEKAADFILAKVFDQKNNILYHRYRDGEAKYEAGLEDYAFFTGGLIDLYEASFNYKWIKSAIELTGIQIKLFYDNINHGFFDTSGNDKTILIKTKEWIENAEPSGNSAAILNLLRLSQMTDNTKWDEIAGNSLAYFSNIINRYPDAMVFMLAAIDFSISKPKQIIIAGSLQNPLTAEILKLIRNHYIPNKIVLLIDNPAEYEKFFPFVKDYIRLEGKTTVYVCENYNCKLPTSDLDEIQNFLMT